MRLGSGKGRKGFEKGRSLGGQCPVKITSSHVTSRQQLCPGCPWEMYIAQAPLPAGRPLCLPVPILLGPKQEPQPVLHVTHLLEVRQLTLWDWVGQMLE